MKLETRLRLSITNLSVVMGMVFGLTGWAQAYTLVTSQYGAAAHGISDPEEVQAFSRRVLPETKHLNPEMVRLLGELKGQYALAIVSNASWKENEMRKMFYNDFELPDDTFETIVTSTSVGVVKPHLEIFRQALSRLGVKAEEAIFTDDMPQFTAAAASLGIHSHTFTSPAGFQEFLATFGIVTSE